MLGRRKKDDSQSPPQPPSQPEQEYTIDMVREMLDSIGLSRLRVTDPRVKVLLTLIAQNGEPYLALMSDGEPSEVQIMNFMDQLKMLEKVIDKYIDIQDHPSAYEKPEEELRSGLEAVNGLASIVVKKSASNERRDLTDFKVNTKILQSLSAHNT